MATNWRRKIAELICNGIKIDQRQKLTEVIYSLRRMSSVCVYRGGESLRVSKRKGLNVKVKN